MVPEARSPESFSWADCQATLDHVRSALKGNNPDAATELRRAFTDAYQMAEHCYDQLVEMEPEEALPDGAFKNWRIFLAGLFKDAWNVYPKHSLVRLDKQKDLQVTIETICKAAEDALFNLLDMHESRSRKPSQRRPVVDKLRKPWLNWTLPGPSLSRAESRRGTSGRGHAQSGQNGGVARC